MGMFDFLKPLKPILAPFEFVGKRVAILINVILLTFVYFTAFALTAILAKIVRKHFLEQKIDENKKSYWSKRKDEDYRNKDNYRGF
jgi:hypothetical protein